MKSESGRMEKTVKEAQAAMASMPPEQRKMLAQQDAAFGAMGNTVRVCITKEETERDEPPQAQQGCTQQHKRSGNVGQLSFRCPGPPPSSGEGQVTLIGPVAYTGSFKLLMVVEGKPGRMTMSMSGKRLGADCGNIKPAGRPPLSPQLASGPRSSALRKSAQPGASAACDRASPACNCRSSCAACAAAVP